MSCLQLALICAVIVAVSCSSQRVCVKGRLVCRDNENDAKNVEIKLWDEDSGPNPDDLMATTRSDANGVFELCGEAGGGIWNNIIDPVLKIYHDCQPENMVCLRKTKFGLPDSVIDSGSVYDMGDINLDINLYYECF